MNEQLEAAKAKLRSVAAELRSNQPDVTKQGAYCDRLDAIVAEMEAIELPGSLDAADTEPKKAGAK
jgi:hypothetical protein